MADSTLVLRLMLTAGLSVAGVGVLCAWILYAISRSSRDPLFAPVGRIRAPGNGLAVIAGFIIVVSTSGILQVGLDSIRFYRAVYGPDFPAGWHEDAATTVRFLWAAAFAFPLQLGLILWIVSTQGGLATLSLNGWSRHAVAGYLTWLLITPAAFCVFALANLAHIWLTNKAPDKHPLTALGNEGGSLEWALFVLQTTLLAPILEELLFRGLLLSWLAQTRPVDPEAPPAVAPSMRPLVIMLLSLAVAILLHIDHLNKEWEARNSYEFAAHLIPGAFFLALIPLLFVGPLLGRLRRHMRVRSIQHFQAIVASSALFAAVHAQVWPSPVPLFVLSLGLGYLYLRTRSLVGPVVVHGMFNAVSAVYLLIGGPA